MKKILIVATSIMLGMSLLHAGSTEKDVSMKCGSGMNMQATEIGKNL